MWTFKVMFYGLNYVTHKTEYSEALISKVTISGDKAFKEVV